jgi:hypothetical protein
MAGRKPIIHGRDHAPGGADPIPGLLTDPGGGDTLDELILAAAPDGWWKLNESSGTVAADSSGNGVDMDSTGWVAPAWAQASGPPGEQTADFNNGSGTAGSGWARVDRTWTTISSDFTAGIWMSHDNTNISTVMGQGDPGRAGGKGWKMGITGTDGLPFVSASGVGTVYALGAVAVNTWAFAAATYHASSTEWKLYVDGLLQGTMTGTFTPATLLDLWIGHDGAIGFPTGAQPCQSTLSYAFLINRVLTGSELLEINNSTVPLGDKTGWVLTINGDGAQEWLPPTIEVEY